MRAISLAALIAVLGGVLMPATRAPAVGLDTSWVAPATEAARVNPLAGRADVLPGGSRLFHQRCSMCHGDDARGTPRGPSLTKPSVQRQSDGALFWKISSGNTRSGMPTFSFLPKRQRWQLVLHIRAQARNAHAQVIGS